MCAGSAGTQACSASAGPRPVEARRPAERLQNSEPSDALPQNSEKARSPTPSPPPKIKRLEFARVARASQPAAAADFPWRVTVKRSLWLMGAAALTVGCSGTDPIKLGQRS